MYINCMNITFVANQFVSRPDSNSDDYIKGQLVNKRKPADRLAKSEKEKEIYRRKGTAQHSPIFPI